MAAFYKKKLILPDEVVPLGWHIGTKRTNVPSKRTNVPSKRTNKNDPMTHDTLQSPNSKAQPERKAAVEILRTVCPL